MEHFRKGSRSRGWQPAPFVNSPWGQTLGAGAPTGDSYGNKAAATSDAQKRAELLLPAGDDEFRFGWCGNPFPASLKL